MRRISELIYTLAFFGCGIWAIVSGTGTLFSGLEDINLTGTWACALMVTIAVSLKIFGITSYNHTKTLVFIGLTALFGGIWGIGTILIILAGVLMVTRGFTQIKVVREQPSMRELRDIRKQKLEEVKDEEIEYQEEPAEESKLTKVSEELLEGFVGSEDHRQEIKTWIDTSDFEKEEFTAEEIRAKAKQELRKNNLSLETLLALEELDKMYGTKVNEEKDLTYVSLDLESTEYEEGHNELEVDESDTEEPVTLEDMMDISLEDLFKG